MADRLAVFVRAPIAGKVKTRLAVDIGPQAALAAHRQLTEHTLKRLTGQRREFQIELWGSEAHEVLDRWGLEFSIPVHLQEGGDLGERMMNCLSQLCVAGDRGVIVGCDCPSIDADYVMAAFDALREYDLVVGPAEDGGYGLIGCSRPPMREVFSGVRWGSHEVLAQTLERAALPNLEVALLSTIWDVDNLADWQRYEALNQPR